MTSRGEGAAPAFLSLGEKVFRPDGKVQVVTEHGLEFTDDVDWRVTLAVESGGTPGTLTDL